MNCKRTKGKNPKVPIRFLPQLPETRQKPKWQETAPIFQLSYSKSDEEKPGSATKRGHARSKTWEVGGQSSNSTALSPISPASSKKQSGSTLQPSTSEIEKLQKFIGQYYYDGLEISIENLSDEMREDYLLSVKKAIVDFVLKDPREQEDQKRDETPDYKKE
ncbi:Hypothetical predicted protein [Paramuricea clavata]|uniref:Uncharacterized protein n=1 Tax=Paramuricea clavata TaxID=317549 RepID=A0A6S7HH95_PARCT|nr:Hypothetical predicted protein [Paramuricea clavata]